VSVIVAIIGLQHGFSFTVSEAQLEYFAQKYPGISFTYITPPLIMSFLTSIINPSPEGFILYIGPIAFTAYIGLLITFINLLPTWQLDGGWVSLSVLGEKRQKILSWISVLVLFLLGYGLMAMLVLFGMWRSRAVMPLDNISSLSTSRKLLSIVLLAVLVLCATYTPYT
ncbi:MAG: site-2 protease family protein, partial [Candidatus Bathyarchaeota archaeon]|nr:site-2 protease family protein [Candidatus Bathyarchaeota archaeon]